MKTHVEDITAKPIVYMRRTGEYGAENYKLMQNMKEWIQRHNLWSENGAIYGVAQDNAAITPPEQCRYDVCFVTEQIFDDDTVTHGELPQGQYLVAQVTHTSEEVKRFWASVGNIAEQECVKIDESRPVLERYKFALVEKGVCEFCIPVLE